MANNPYHELLASVEDANTLTLGNSSAFAVSVAHVGMASAVTMAMQNETSCQHADAVALTATVLAGVTEILHSRRP